MEYLIVLIAIASFLYKTYKGYQEEMEKAKKRQPNRPNPDSPPPIPVPQHRPAQERTSIPPVVVPQRKQIRNKEVIPPPVVASYEKKTIPDEVRQVQERKALQKLAAQQQSSLTNRLSLENDEDHAHQEIHFDLRQAVIQSAILERPYK